MRGATDVWKGMFEEGAGGNWAACTQSPEGKSWLCSRVNGETFHALEFSYFSWLWRQFTY